MAASASAWCLRLCGPHQCDRELSLSDLELCSAWRRVVNMPEAHAAASKLASTATDRELARLKAKLAYDRTTSGRGYGGVDGLRAHDVHLAPGDRAQVSRYRSVVTKSCLRLDHYTTPLVSLALQFVLPATLPHQQPVTRFFPAFQPRTPLFLVWLSTWILGAWCAEPLCPD